MTEQKRRPGRPRKNRELVSVWLDRDLRADLAREPQKASDKVNEALREHLGKKP